MKRGLVFAVLVPVLCLAISSCSFLYPLNRLETGSFLLSDVETDINGPDWLDNSTLIANMGRSATLNELDAATGEITGTYTIADPEIANTASVSLSPDGSLVALQVWHQGPTYDPASDNYDELPHADILVHNLATGVTANLTGSNGWFGHPTFLSNTEVAYFHWDDSVEDESTTRLVKHNLVADLTSNIFEYTDPVVDGVSQGDSYWWCQASPDGTKVIACTHSFVRENISFAVFSTVTGEKLFDGFSLGAYDAISRGDWVDGDTIVIAHGTDADSALTIIDINFTTGNGTVVSDIPIVEERIHQLYGLHISPDGTMVASHAQETDSAGEHVANRLLVARIAERP